MATPTVTPELNQPSTSTPDINQSADALRAAALATPQTPEAPPAPAADPAPSPAAPTPVQADGVTYTKQADGSYHIKLATGEEFKGTADDVVVAMGKAQISTKEWGKGFKEQLEAKNNPQPQAPEVDPAEQFIAETVAKSLGFASAEDMKAFVGNSRQEAVASREQRLALEFHRLAPEFPATPDATQAVLKYAAENGMIQVDANGVIVSGTPQALRAAHLACVAEKKYIPLTQEQMAAQQVTKPATPAPIIPPQRNETPAQTINPYDLNVPLEKLREQAMAR
jgi:hypothetical protein